MTKRAWFRFYEELNDFLPSSRRKVAFPLTIKGTQTVKDAIEGCGVPHVEVDLILVNGKSVDFSYRLKNSDQVSVYPAFETLDIKDVTHLREKPLREPAFILDVHLGKLARYLRLCGFDSLYRTDYEDIEIINIAAQEKRIILTRDKKLLANKKVTHGVWIRSQKPAEQFREVFDRLDLGSRVNPFTRCMGCNSLLAEVNKEEISDRLHPGTRKHYNAFSICTGCGKIYWEGSHYEKMKQVVKNFTGHSIP